MKETIKIIAPSTALRISDFMTELPNGLLNKVSTGVGGTHLTLVNSQPYIITVPTIELILNKCSQHDNLLGLHGSFGISEIKHYLHKYKGSVPKIMVTYDGLPKLLSMLSTLGNPYTEYRLLVDEYHELLNAYSYRDKKIDRVLEEAKKFTNVCFMSATPINAKYCPPQLKDYDSYEIVWQDITKIIPIRKKTNKPYQATVNIIKQYKAGGYSIDKEIEGVIHKSTEAYFFLNSVKAIKDIIDNADLKQSEVKIICSNSERNKEILEDFEINKAHEPNKPFTFVTAKAFCGTDFYSSSGIIYIVSNVAKSNTLLDVATECFQIAGRIRNTENPFKNRIYHIYNTGARETTKEQFKKNLDEKVNRTNLMIEAYDSMTEIHKAATIDTLGKDADNHYLYINEETNTIAFNELKMLNEQFEYEIVFETYTNGLSIRNAYLKAGFDVTQAQEWEDIEEQFIDNLSSIQFRDIMKEYITLIDCKNTQDCECSEDRIQYLETLNPEIKNIIETIGTSKIKTMGYSKKKINTFIKEEGTEVQDKVFKQLQKHLKANIVYPSNQIKEIVQNIYNLCKIKRTAKATDLTKYYTVSKKVRSINGKKVDSIIILN